jgi:hypothetical protein
MEEPILGSLCTLKIAVKARGEAALGNMLALEDATHCEVVASAGPAFGHQQRGKSVAVNAGTGGVENWVSERCEEPIEPQGLSESHQQERFNLQVSSKEMGTGTGSSGLEQMSGTGTLATSVGMGGSVGLGLSGSLGQEAGGGRSEWQKLRVIRGRWSCSWLLAGKRRIPWSERTQPRPWCWNSFLARYMPAIEPYKLRRCCEFMLT